MHFVALLWFNVSQSLRPSVNLSVVGDQTHFKSVTSDLCQRGAAESATGLPSRRSLLYKESESKRDFSEVRVQWCLFLACYGRSGELCEVQTSTFRAMLCEHFEQNFSFLS